MTNSAIPQNAAQALDAILTAWSESHRLSVEQIETIRASLIKDSEVMSYEWWWTLFKGIGLVNPGNTSTQDSIRSLASQAIARALPVPAHGFVGPAEFQLYMRHQVA